MAGSCFMFINFPAALCRGICRRPIYGAGSRPPCDWNATFLGDSWELLEENSTTFRHHLRAETFLPDEQKKLKQASATPSPPEHTQPSRAEIGL